MIDHAKLIEKHNPELFNRVENHDLEERYQNLANQVQDIFQDVAKAYGESLATIESQEAQLTNLTNQIIRLTQIETKRQAVIDAATAWHKLKLFEAPEQSVEASQWIIMVGERCRALDDAIEDFLKTWENTGTEHSGSSVENVSAQNAPNIPALE